MSIDRDPRQMLDSEASAQDQSSLLDHKHSPLAAWLREGRIFDIMMASPNNYASAQIGCEDDGSHSVLCRIFAERLTGNLLNHIVASSADGMSKNNSANLPNESLFNTVSSRSGLHLPR